MPNEMPSLSIPPQITFVKGRFVTDSTEQIAQLPQYVRLFPQEIYLLPSDNEKKFNTRVGLLQIFKFSSKMLVA